MTLKLLFIMLFVNILSSFAQNDSISNSIVKDYDDKVTVTVYNLKTSNGFVIISGQGANEQYFNLTPNYKSQLGISLAYQFIDVSFSFAPKFFPGNKDNADSKLMSFNYNLFLKKWVQSFTYIHQKGFSIDESDFSFPLPDMRTTKIGTTTSYVFNDNFSYKTVLNQNAWQRKSSGSFIPKFSFYYTHLNFGSDFDNSNGNMYLFSIAPSYYYNFVIRDHFLIGPGVGFGAGINILDKDVYALYQFDFNLKLGYNRDNFFAFLHSTAISFIQNDNAEARLDDSITSFNISVGYRFDAPKKVKKIYDRVHEKTGL